MSTVSTEASGPNALSGADGALRRAILVALDGLLRAFELEPSGGDRFRVASEPGRFARIFGGQTVAQALLAASATVTEKAPQSMHAYFVDAGTPDQPLDLAVDRVRDGRSMSTRRVTVTQDERPLLTVIASFHENPTSPELADPPPAVPRPEQLPALQDWVRDAPPELHPHASTWVEQPPPVELRIGEAPTFLGGPPADGMRSHWMRVPRDVGDNPLLHAALLAYASDYLLLDMAFRSYPDRAAASRFTGFSLDHTLWFHRPVRFDHWHLHSQQTLAVVGHRALVQGSIRDADGHLVASVMQEALVRPAR
jgi:acyl-CoA thioesterase-2